MTHNELSRSLQQYSALFDTVERAPLTHEQRVAAVTTASRQLLVAAAGSGKTSTMVGKVAYALHSRQCAPDQVLVLAFNRKAALELDERLRRCLSSVLPGETGVTARTLHALGLDIVSKVRGQRPEVRDAETGLLDDVLTATLAHNPVFAAHWLAFRVFYQRPLRHPDRFSTRRQWAGYVQRYGDRHGHRTGFTTLRGELVGTQFEEIVANWLYLHGVDYQYQRVSRRHAGPGRRSVRSRWWTAVQGWALWGWVPGVRCALQQPLQGHFGFWLNQYGRYVLCVQDASILGKAHASRHTVLDLRLCREGTLYSELMRQLGLTGQALPDGRVGQVLSLFGQRFTAGQREFLARFIRIARLSGQDTAELQHRALQSADADRATLHAPMLAGLLQAYDRALRDAGAIDFEGMLHQAADVLNNRQYQHPYRLILVDEFQDTSQGGVRLLQALLGQNPQCRLFAVGDDRQSIYRFAGAVPDVLSRFEHYFGPATVNYLTATFRFSQVIADLAGRFVQANPMQMRKQLQARTPYAEPAVVLARYATVPHMYALCERCLEDAAEAWGHAATTPDSGARIQSVYILGRYQHQRPSALPQWQARFPMFQIEFQTAHSAKGLEADIVIVLGLSAGRYGFPSEVPDDALMTLVSPPVETYPHAEERRLFYVALTRCRERLYLLADLRNPSCFVPELRALSPDIPLRVL